MSTLNTQNVSLNTLTAINSAETSGLFAVMNQIKQEVPEISKSTLNFAAKRDMLVDICESDEVVVFDRVWIYLDVDACEPDVSYIAHADGSFTFFGNLGLPKDVKEELPAYIKDEKQLCKVIDFIHSEMKSK